jgi:hypothetical protein
MELDDRALPLTRRQLDILLAQETGHSDTERRPGLFVRIEGPVEASTRIFARSVDASSTNGNRRHHELNTRHSDRAPDGTT